MQKILLGLLLFLAGTAFAQRKSSIDLAAIRNTRLHMNGLNVSVFHHFSEKLVAGIEMNRFFPSHKTIGTEKVNQSAWDFDYNMHYLIPVHKGLKAYPILGFSHSAEKEHIEELNENIYNRFWSANTGVGLLLETGRVSPHIEYLLTWGKMNQQFVLAGISYEIDW